MIIQMMFHIIALNNVNLASSFFDKMVKIWQKLNETSFELKANLTGHTDWVNSLAVSSNDLLASASDDSTIRI